MSLVYKNPISSNQLRFSESVSRVSTFGTNFSVLQVGGYMEVYKLSDLLFTIPSGSTGTIEFTGNTIPIHFSVSDLPFIPNTLTLNSDNISSGRRKLGMLVYVYETQQTYCYTIPNYDILWNNASGSTQESDFTTTVTTSTQGGQDFINAWLDSSIEGVNGVTRDNARWRIFYGTDTFLTGATFSGGTATLTNNNGDAINIEGIWTDIPNNALDNDSITIGTTEIELGGTSTTLSGLTSVNATTFTGDDIGTETKRFRSVNTISGSTTYWSVSEELQTPKINLGDDSQGTSRIITADNSVIQSDTLFGGDY